MEKKIIIVGAGISGLTAGIYARKAGFDVAIYESHTVAGGMCTAWKRKGYTIDGCIHWITGSKKDSDLYKIWETCGALGDNIEVVHHDYLAAFRDENGYHYVFSDPDKLEKELLSISAEDAGEIKQLVKIIKICQKLPIPAGKPQELFGLFDKLRFYFPYIKYGKHLSTVSKISISDYISRFRSPVIKQMLYSIIPNPNLTAVALFSTLATFASRDDGWPQGGSRAMAERIKERFISMGGRIYLGMPVEKIMVENGTAVGIKLKNQAEIPADYIVPAISADVLFEQLLDGKYRDAYFEERFADNKNYLLMSATLAAFGVNTDMAPYPHNLYVKTRRPLRINKTEITEFCINHYCHEPSFAPAGKSVMEVLLLDSEFEYWQKLKNSSAEEYKRAKEELTAQIVEEIEHVYPEIKNKIEMTDMATPPTFHRYTESYRGSYMSFCTTPGASFQNHEGTIQGLKNVYLAGQWALLHGGLPMAAMAGKFAVQRICKAEKMKIDF